MTTREEVLRLFDRIEQASLAEWQAYDDLIDKIAQRPEAWNRYDAAFDRAKRIDEARKDAAREASDLLQRIQRDYPNIKRVVHLDPGLLFWRIVIPPNLSLQRWLVNPESTPLSVVMKTIDVPLTLSIARGDDQWLVGMHDDTAYLSKVK